MTHQTTPAGIAAALRRAADDIEAMGDVELSPILVGLNLQAVRHGGAVAERIATVDALSVALVGAPGVVPDGFTQHHEPDHLDDSRGDLTVAIYTGLAEYTGGAK